MRGGGLLEGLQAQAETQRMNAWIGGKANTLGASNLGHLVHSTAMHVEPGQMIDISCVIAMEVSQIQTNPRNMTGKTYLVLRLVGNAWWNEGD